MKNLVAAYGLVAILAACTGPVSEAPSPLLTLIGDEPIVFPLLPEQTRVPYLYSFRSSVDIVPEKARGSLSDFLVGDDQKAPFRMITKAFGVAAYGEKIYVCDTRGRNIGLWVVDPGEQTFERFTPSGQGQLSKPISIYIDKAGEKYSADVGRGAVLRFGANDKLIEVYGRKELTWPVGVTVVGEEVFILDSRDHKVEVYDRVSGAFKRVFGGLGEEEGQFSFPVGICSDKQGHI